MTGETSSSAVEITVYEFDDGRCSIVQYGPLAYFDSLSEAEGLISLLKELGARVVKCP